jgi:hypothetical protein
MIYICTFHVLYYHFDVRRHEDGETLIHHNRDTFKATENQYHTKTQIHTHTHTINKQTMNKLSTLMVVVGCAILANVAGAWRTADCVRCQAPDSMTSQCLTAEFCLANRQGWNLIRPKGELWDCVPHPPRWQKQVGNPCATRGNYNSRVSAEEARKRSKRRLRAAEWENENVGGGRVYGEYSNGPYTAGAEYNWDEEEGDERVGGFMDGFKCGSCAANHGQYKCRAMGYC